MSSGPIFRKGAGYQGKKSRLKDKKYSYFRIPFGADNDLKKKKKKKKKGFLVDILPAVCSWRPNRPEKSSKRQSKALLITAQIFKR